MNPRVLWRHAGMRAAATLLAVAIGVNGWTLVRALRADPIPDVALPTLASAGLTGVTRARAPGAIEDAVDNDPFSPDRTASAAYRMPGEPDSRTAEPATEPEKPALIGTAVSADGRSFAVLQMGDARTVSRYVGDTIGVFTVRVIERARVVLASPRGKRIELSAIKPPER